MKLLNFFQEKFWFPLLISLIVGLAFPELGKQLNNLVIPLLMIMFFLTCLKVNFLEVVAHTKKPLFLIYILIIYLLLIPTILYGIFQFFNPEIAIGILLLAAIPPAVAAPILTNIFKGNTTLSMAIALASYIVFPFTVLLLFFLLTQKVIILDLANLFKTLLLVNFLPLIAAQIVRKTNKLLIEKTKNYFTLINICCMSLITYIVVAIQANDILQNPFSAFIDILWLYLFFSILFIVGYGIAFWKKKSDKVAIKNLYE